MASQKSVIFTKLRVKNSQGLLLLRCLLCFLDRVVKWKNDSSVSWLKKLSGKTYFQKYTYQFLEIVKCISKISRKTHFFEEKLSVKKEENENT